MAHAKQRARVRRYIWWLCVAAALILGMNTMAFWGSYGWAGQQFPDGYVISYRMPR
jgi:hypothetical protein